MVSVDSHQRNGSRRLRWCGRCLITEMWRRVIRCDGCGDGYVVAVVVVVDAVGGGVRLLCISFVQFGSEIPDLSI